MKALKEQEALSYRLKDLIEILRHTFFFKVRISLPSPH
jgi:hypothetical protein